MAIPRYYEVEDFHTKAMRLVTQAGYEGDAKEQVLRDTIISGIASEKIRASERRT